jgi:DNA-binding NarL/FixJ family response regulator
MTQIYIIDDHPVIRAALRSLLEREPDLAVCGEAASAEQALDEAASTGPNLVLIDVSLPGMSGIELARVLRERHPALPLAMLSGHSEKSYVNQAFEAGAHGYLVKGRHEEIVPAIRQVARGKRYLSARFGK